MMINTSLDSSLVLQSAFFFPPSCLSPPVTVCSLTLRFLHKRLARLPLFHLLPAKQQKHWENFP